MARVCGGQREHGPRLRRGDTACAGCDGAGVVDGRSPGARAATEAVAAARAGADVVLVAAVGQDDTGAALRAHLESNNVDVGGVIAGCRYPAGRPSIVVDAQAENVIVVAPGANGHLSLSSPRLRDLVAGCEVLLMQLEIPTDTALAAARVARAAGATVLRQRLAGGRRSGRAGAAGRRSPTWSSSTNPKPGTGSGRFPTWSPHLGARGAVHRSGGGETRVAAPAVEAVDTTGAGDVFAGVLAAGWATGPAHALRRACAAGALATLVPGAGDCAPDDEAIEDALN